MMRGAEVLGGLLVLGWGLEGRQAGEEGRRFAVSTPNIHKRQVHFQSLD